MPSNPEGLAIARQRIAAEKVARTGFLDLGMLGLEELPEELFEVKHLWGLNLGTSWSIVMGGYRGAAEHLAANRLDSQIARLSELEELRQLILIGMQIGTLDPLAGLLALQSLDCSNTGVSDLSPLAGLPALQSLNCSGAGVSDLSPLAGLPALQSLDCSSTKVSDLSPLAGLPALQSLLCWGAGVSDLSPLAGLPALQSLDCSFTKVSDLSPLAGLPALQSLRCPNTGVSDLSPLAGLPALRSLLCPNTGVSDLSPLAGLPALQTLDCPFTKVSDLSPLAGLPALQSLDCPFTKVSDLSPLAGLPALQWLDCSGTTLVSLPFELIWRKSLQEFIAYKTRIPGIPPEVLSPDPATNCLESLRAHLQDLEAGEEWLPDVKVLVLGNGRIGKTQICRRLRGEDFDPTEPSTHGILVTSADLPIPPGAARSAPATARLHLWDFGGQDLYHGTHALFLGTRSIFLLVWTPASNDAREHQHGGLTFRNHPLPYWLEYIRQQCGDGSPVLLVQNQCERPEDETLRPPVEDEALRSIGFRKVLHYSALNDRGRRALDEALGQAVGWIWEQAGRVTIGKGRMEVKRRLEALRDADADEPAPERRKYRKLSQGHFRQLCDEAGGVSDPGLLLDYLNATGIVFYRRGLFEDQIVLDQAWALEAVYAVFHRERCFRQLRQLRGRFTRSLLEALAWGKYSIKEQGLFLSLMQSSGVCFVHRPEDTQKGTEAEYIAPDLLPDRAEVAAEIERSGWDGRPPDARFAVRFPFLHPGLIRGLISRVGRKAGFDAVYWNEGVCLYDAYTQSHALIERTRDYAPGAWGGRIGVSCRGGRAGELLGVLREWVEREIQHAGCRGWTVEESSDRPGPGWAARLGSHRPEMVDPADATPEPKLDIKQPPSPVIEYCVSYAWNDESKAIVDRLCVEAEGRGVKILRDTTGLGLGESIGKFMMRLGAGDRVFVILSKKYLESPYCMFELLEVWRNSKGDPEEFRRRIRVFRLADAAMSTPIERARCAKHWKEQFRELDELVRADGADLLGEADFRRYKLMQDFAHRVGDILALIADTLLPRDFDELKQHGFRDEPNPTDLPG